MSEQPTTIAVIQQYTPERVQQLVATLTKYRDVITADLATIQTINDDAQYLASNNLMVEAKAYIDKATTKRKAFSDPIKQALTELMVYEHDLATAYTRARGVLEAYNQKKIEEKQLKEKEAQKAADLIKYKAEFRAEVQKALAGKISGLHKTVIQKFASWEAGLQLPTFDNSVKALRDGKIELKQDAYNECFRRWGNSKGLMTPEQEDAYLTELKTELTYESYNNQYQELIAPIKNEYLARVDQIKSRLTELAAADEKKKKDLLAKQEQERKDKEARDLQAANDKNTAALQSIDDQKDINKTEGDFTQQMMTADLNAPPSKKVASFASDAAWLAPFLKVVAKVGAHPKFKGIFAKDGYTPAIKSWMTFYGDNIAEPLEGIKLTETAKTIVKAKE